MTEGLKGRTAYSVLMSVYGKEKPDYLRTAMNSMWRQTVPTDDFVLVCDGPLTEGLEKVISDMQAAHPEAFHAVRLPENRGLGCALRIGVQECRNGLIARMDSDDISRPERCEKELAVLAADPELAICGSVIEEFTAIGPDAYMPASVGARRMVPERSEEILRFARKRNPFNHPSVMFRKEAVLAAGNYQDVRYLQDYYLWTHMLLAGFRGYNIQEPLVYMRADDNLYRRRSGKTYRGIQLNLFRYMRDQGFISGREYAASCVLRTGASMAPNWLRRLAYRKVLRKT